MIEKRAGGIIRHFINFGKDAAIKDNEKVEEILVPDNVIDQLNGKTSGKMKKIQLLCAPAVVSKPTFCDSRNVWIIKIEGTRHSGN